MYPGNALIILAVLAGKVTWSEMLFEWMMVFSGNVLGAMASAFVVFSGGVCDDTDMLLPANATHVVGSSGRVVGTIGETVCRAALAKAGLHGYQIFMRGVLANVIACLGAFLAVSSPSAGGKVLSFVVTIQAFAASSYEHCIANVYTFSLATYLGCPVETRLLFVYNVVLATVGNIVGAAILAVAYFLVFIRASAEETMHFTPASHVGTPQVTRRGGVVSSEQPGTVAGPLSPTAGGGGAANQTTAASPTAGTKAARAPLPRWAQTVKNLLRVASGAMDEDDGEV